jgi:hypothetical protein
MERGYRGITTTDLTLDARDERSSDAVISDDELAALALAADPEAPVDDDAVPLWELVGYAADRYLPEWYMPAPLGGRVLRGWRRRVIVLLIVSFLVIDAYGLCNTYGLVKFG